MVTNINNFNDSLSFPCDVSHLPGIFVILNCERKGGQRGTAVSQFYLCGFQL